MPPSTFINGLLQNVKLDAQSHLILFPSQHVVVFGKRQQKTSSVGKPTDFLVSCLHPSPVPSIFPT